MSQTDQQTDCVFGCSNSATHETACVGLQSGNLATHGAAYAELQFLEQDRLQVPEQNMTG